jgi:hypothetical protein
VRSDLASPLLTAGQAARFLALAPQTLANWRVSGHGPAFLKLGGAVRYDLADLRAFLDQQRHGQAAPANGNGKPRLNGHRRTPRPLPFE